jgi:poly-gamma-glutamate synthesis protein (capsule biosynthesis protein)
MTTSGHFPDGLTDEPDLPAHHRFRAEGMPFRQAIWGCLRYLRKYLDPLVSAPPEELTYFDRQRQLLAWLHHRATEPPSGSRLGLVGDLMWLRRGWKSFLSPGVLEYLNAHVAVLGNLESPISRRFSVPWLWPDYIRYNSHPGLLTSFHRPGGGSTFSALSTANNHCLDCGDEGLADTLEFLDSLGIGHSGVRPSAEDRNWIRFEAGGFSFGFLAACWGLNDPARLASTRWHIEVVPGVVSRDQHPVDLTRIRQALAEMTEEQVDFRIVSLHWGYEFELFPCPDLMQVGREIVRAGADLIVGSHPHVLQPLEVCLVNGYEKRLLAQGLAFPALREPTGCLLTDAWRIPRKALIAYSLGNFTTAMFTAMYQMGLILSLTLARDEATGRVDWHRPEVQLVFNVQRDRNTRQRRLVLLESWLRERERAGDRAVNLRQLGEVLHRHVLGV